MNDAFDFPENTDVGNFIDREGQYIFLTREVDEGHVSKNTNTPGIEFSCEVIGGTAPQNGKSMNIVSYNPKERGDFPHRIRGRFAIAHALVPVIKDDKGNVQADPSVRGQKINIDWQHCQSKLWVGFVKNQPFKNQKGDEVPSFKIDGADIYHIEDAAVKHVVEAAMKDPQSAKIVNLFRQSMPQIAGGQQTAANGASGSTALPAAPIAPTNVNQQQPVAAGATGGWDGMKL